MREGTDGVIGIYKGKKITHKHINNKSIKMSLEAGVMYYYSMTYESWMVADMIPVDMTEEIINDKLY